MVVVLLCIVYAIGVVCIFAMKKLQPENTVIYGVWVVAVCVMLTLFVVWYGSVAQQPV